VNEISFQSTDLI